jgi:hypothetical protein
MALVGALSISAVLGAGGVATASVAAKSREVSAEKYAKTMCTTYNKLLADTNQFAEDLGASPQSDPAALQANVRSLADALMVKLKAAEKKLKSVYPDVDGGKKISKQFAKNAVELQTIIGDAVDKFTAADPTSPAFSADVTVLGVALTTLGTQLTDVTTGIDNQDFIGAVGDEKSCKEIFPVTGG